LIQTICVKKNLLKFQSFAAPAVEGSGVNGVIYTVEPLDACSPLSKRAVEGPISPFALILRGGCQFDDKVRNAQDAGFKAVIVYDNKDHGVLVSSNVT
jgi:E3 ubiquitin-protein ligase RNF13